MPARRAITMGAAIVAALVVAGVASALDTGPALPSSGTNVSSGGSVTWTNPGNVTATDGTTVNSSFSANGQSTDILLASGFGFSVPTGSTIDGVYVEIVRRTTGGSTAEDNSVQLFHAGAGIGSSSPASGAWPTVLTAQSYGSSTSLWGATLTPAIVNHSTFGVALTARTFGSATSANLRVDSVTVTVYYTEEEEEEEPPPPPEPELGECPEAPEPTDLEGSSDAAVEMRYARIEYAAGCIALTDRLDALAVQGEGLTNRADLAWWGSWAIVGVLLGSVAAPMLSRSFRWWRE